MKKRIVFLSLIAAASMPLVNNLTTKAKSCLEGFSNFTEENSGFATGSGRTPEHAFVDVISQVPKGAYVYRIHTRVFRSTDCPEKTSAQVCKEYSGRIPSAGKGAFRVLSLLNSARNENWSFDIGWVVLS